MLLRLRDVTMTTRDVTMTTRDVTRTLLLRVTIVLLLVTVARAGSDDCTIPKKIVTQYDKFNIKITSGDSDLEDVAVADDYEIDSGTALTLACSRDGEVFVNSVRNVEGVNITYIDEDSRGEIITTCSSGSMYPDFFSVVQSSKMAKGYRHVYCQPGCNRLLEYSHSVQYPTGTLTTESSSPPVAYSDKTVELSCKKGFVVANGDVGEEEMVCDLATKGWSTDMSGRINCLRGCKDVRESVDYATTEISANTKDGEPPFQAGDILAFSCDEDRSISGYSTVTCNSLNKWSSDLPTCLTD